MKRYFIVVCEFNNGTRILFILFFFLGSRTQSFGFYPLVGRKSIAMGAVTNAMKDNGGHVVHGSITMDNISAAQFTTLINTAKSLATMDYDLNDYNCTNYAIAVFNSIRGSGPIAIPNTYGVGTPMRPIINYGQTPNSLFKFISQNAGSYSNLNVTPHQAAASHGECP